MRKVGKWQKHTSTTLLCVAYRTPINSTVLPHFTFKSPSPLLPLAAV